MEQEMTEAYIQGFLAKCAEHGVPRIISEWMLKKSNAKSKELFGMTNLQHAKELQKTASLDLKKLFPSSKFPTKQELKEKERLFSVGDRVKVSDHIRCFQKGHTGTIVHIDPEDDNGWKSFIVEFDDKKYRPMGFHSGNIDKVSEKKT